MRPTQWLRKHTFRSINRKAAIIKYKNIPDKDKYLKERGRLSKINISDIAPSRKKKYNRAKSKREFMLELVSYNAS